MPHKSHSYVAIALAGACAALLFFATPVRAQDSQSQDAPSVADAARQARAAKKNAKAAKVISDEDISPSSYKPGDQGLNVGSAPTSDSQAPNAAEVKSDLKADETQLAAETAKVKPGEDPAIAHAKAELAAAAAKLDLLKRANALDQDTYFSKPGYTDDHTGKSKLDAEQAEINDQQAVVDDLKAKLEQLKAEHGAVDAEPTSNKKPAKPKNAGLSLPDKTAPDQPAPDEQTAPQPQS
ncbi:MAG TPA: hypothetical protein VMP12_05180 [Candidatus Sulfotelmatobacter sp.]|nr:hypothetical protein [Candidatus Sulfotelmatobacter sp.]